MANLPISGLTASAANLASTDLAPIVQTAGVGPVKMTGLQLAGGLLGSATFNGATVTTSQPVLNLSQTWNAGAVSFTGLRFNATDTASASGSLLLDLQVGGASKFQIFKNGAATAGGAFTVLNTGGSSVLQMAQSASYGYHMASGYAVTWGSSATLDGSIDLTLRRAAAATLQLGAADAAAPVAQTLQVQSVVAGTSNTAGANWTLKGSAGTGTGAGGSIIFQVAPAGSSGTAQNAYATALTIDSTRTVTAALAINANTFQNSGGQGITATAAQLGLFNTGLFGWTNNAGSAGALDTILVRDAANTLALRNGATAQRLNIYGTYTDAANYERVGLYYSAGDAYYLAFDKAGTGSNRNLKITSGGDLYFQITGGSYYWYFTNAGGHLFAGADNTYDIGASAANRPRNVYVAGQISCAGGTIPTVKADYINNSTNNRTFWQFATSADSAQFGIGMTAPIMQFGGTTSSFPALKRSTTTLQVRLADDSAFADIGARGVIHNGVTFANLPGTPTTGTVAYVTDASNAGAAWGDSVTAGGSTNKYLVWYNGTNWTVVGK